MNQEETSPEPRRMGPQTEEGRMAVAQNALTHGLWSNKLVLEDVEQPEEWEEHLNAIIQDLAPEGSIERALANRIAILAWRLYRVVSYEASMTNAGIRRVRRSDERYNRRAAAQPEKNLPLIDEFETRRKQELELLPEPRLHDQILRVESHLHRQYIQSLHELEARQAHRRGEGAPLARVDISAPPGSHLAAARGRAPAPATEQLLRHAEALLANLDE